MALDLSVRYAVENYPGIAWRVLGFTDEQFYDEEAGTEVLRIDETQVIAVMVGDDRPFTFGVDELEPLAEGAYCHECGQIGCGWHT